jgi:flagellar basal body rod protein FlgG
MANSVYIAMSGAIAAQRRLEVLANNLANGNTTGYKQVRVGFDQFLVPRADGSAVKGFTAITRTQVDGTAGAVERTNAPLDAAIQEDGFFAVLEGEEVLLTRAGNFHVSPENLLVDGGGRPVLGGDPRGNRTPITVRPDAGPVAIGEDGSVVQDGTSIASLAIVTVPNTALTPRGDGHYRVPAEAMTPVTDAQLLPGHLESSNVNVVRGMVDLIETTRSYETQHRLMSQFRELDRKTMEIAR